MGGVTKILKRAGRLQKQNCKNAGRKPTIFNRGMNGI